MPEIAYLPNPRESVTTFSRVLWPCGCDAGDSSSAMAASLRDGLIAFYKLGESSSPWNDSHTLGLHHNLNSAPAPIAVAGKVGNSLSFTPTGSTKLVDPSRDHFFDFTSTGPFGVTPFEISAWAWQNDNTQDGAIMEAGETYSVGYSGSIGYHFVVQIDVIDQVVVQSNVLPANNTWTFVQAWYIPNVGAWISVNNGAPEFTPVPFSPFNLTWDTGNTRIGLGILSYQAGRIDELGIWKRLNTQDERDFKYNGGTGAGPY